MPTINQFDKINLKSLRSEINSALKTVADKNGISLSIGNITFDVAKFTCRLTAETKGPKVTNTQTIDSNPVAFEIAGLKVGDSFRHNTKVLTIIGYNPRKPKNCVMLADQNGKKFNCSLEMAKQKLNN